jgi:hypothetical protein
MENHVGMVSTGENFVHQSALAILPAESIAKCGKLEKKTMNLEL